MTEAETRQRLKDAVQSDNGRFIVDHVQRVFGVSATLPSNVSDARIAGRLEVIQYLVTQGEVVRERDTSTQQ